MDDLQPITLDELCAQNAEQILARLVKELKEAGGPAYQRMPLEVLENRVEKLFDAFWQAIAQKNPKPLTDYVWMTGRERGHEGFTVGELHTVAVRLRNALLDLVDQACAGSPELQLSYSRTVEELVLVGISTGVQGFVDGREALIARQAQALLRNRSSEQ